MSRNSSGKASSEGVEDTGNQRSTRSAVAQCTYIRVLLWAPIGNACVVPQYLYIYKGTCSFVLLLSQGYTCNEMRNMFKIYLNAFLCHLRVALLTSSILGRATKWYIVCWTFFCGGIFSFFFEIRKTNCTLRPSAFLG